MAIFDADSFLSRRIRLSFAFFFFFLFISFWTHRWIILGGYTQKYIFHAQQEIQYLPWGMPTAHMAGSMINWSSIWQVFIFVLLSLWIRMKHPSKVCYVDNCQKKNTIIKTRERLLRSSNHYFQYCWIGAIIFVWEKGQKTAFNKIYVYLTWYIG
jgi:hypothetical protein